MWSKSAMANRPDWNDFDAPVVRLGLVLSVLGSGWGWWGEGGDGKG